jgi:hypothetical protein
MLTGALLRMVKPVGPLKELASIANSPLETAIRQLRYIEGVGVRWVLCHNPYVGWQRLGCHGRSIPHRI